MKSRNKIARAKQATQLSGFLNVDLQIESAARLDCIAEELSTRVIELYSGPAPKAKRHLLALESSRQFRGPDAAIRALCSAVESLSPAARRVWKAARKEFDVGYELGASECSSRFALRPDTLERVARLGAGLAVTCYRKQTIRSRK